jgi:hypothetical protein
MKCPRCQDASPARRFCGTPADAGRITQPILAVLGADSHTLWPGWVEVHQLVQAWLRQTSLRG